MIRECVMNGVGCVQVINDVVLIASNGTIDLQLKGNFDLNHTSRSVLFLKFENKVTSNFEILIPLLIQLNS